MRFTVMLFFIALLPVVMVAHWWHFEEHQQPKLQAKVKAVLDDAEVRGATVELRYLDLHVAGFAPDEKAVQKVREGLAELGVLRLVSFDLGIQARMRAVLEGEVLRLDGWLADEGTVESLRLLLQSLRPDLKIQASELKVSPLVKMPEGESLPLTEKSTMLQPIIKALYVPSELEILREGGRLRARGMLPAAALREAVIAALSSGPHGLPVDAQSLKATSYALTAAFTEQKVLIPFLNSFYSTLSPGNFQIKADENPRLVADATRSLESAWLSHLLPLTQGRVADLKLTYFPSHWHFPGRRLETALPEDALQPVRDQIAGLYIAFPSGSAALRAEEKARLAQLVPALLAAGPALKLTLGGHPDPSGDLKAEAALAKRRAEAVVSYLIEQGAPTQEMRAVAFDPVPTGSSHAPSLVPSVEILIQ